MGQNCGWARTAIGGTDRDRSELLPAAGQTGETHAALDERVWKNDSGDSPRS